MAFHAGNHDPKKGLKCKELLIDIPSDLEPAEWPECCIYRVPKELRKVNEEAYTPKLISIGPLHNYRREEFKDMEMQKLRYLRDFCDRTGKSQKDLASIIEEKDVKIRHCYAETSTLSTDEFVNMILLDGIFIIELFLKNYEKKEHGKDYILSKPWLRNGIQHDLLLLENQLPYFVLEDVYNNSVFNGSPFLELCRKYFSKYDRLPLSDIGAEVIKHFTDLLRHVFCRPSLQKENRKKAAIDKLYSATKLDEAGVIFKGVKEKHLLDIKFKRATWLNCLPCSERKQKFLELSAFEVGHQTDCVFRNIMALEQCHYPMEDYMCNYILVLGYLINSEKDVELLVEKNVIVNKLGTDDEVVRLVKKLGHQIVAEDSCYYELSQMLNGHCEDYQKRIKAHEFLESTAKVVEIVFS